MTPELLPSVVRHRVKAYLESTRRTDIDENRIVLGKGVFPVLAALMATLTQRLGRAPIVALPVGSYGPLYTLVTYHGGKAIEVKTDAKRGFMVDVGAIEALDVKPDLLWLTQPNNPSGLFYDSQAVESLYKACSERGIYMLADEIFLLAQRQSSGRMDSAIIEFSPAHKNRRRKISIPCRWCRQIICCRWFARRIFSLSRCRLCLSNSVDDAIAAAFHLARMGHFVFWLS